MWILTAQQHPPLHVPVLVRYRSGQLAVASCGKRGTHRVWGNNGSSRFKGDEPVKWHEIPKDEDGQTDNMTTTKEITQP